MELKDLLKYKLHDNDSVHELRYNDLMEKYEETNDFIRTVWANIIKNNSLVGYEKWFFKEDIEDFNEIFANVDVYAKNYNCMSSIFDLIIKHSNKTGMWSE